MRIGFKDSPDDNKQFILNLKRDGLGYLFGTFFSKTLIFPRQNHF